MQAYWTLTRRELGAYFLSLTGYLIIAAAALLLGGSFVVALKSLQQMPTTMPVTESLYAVLLCGIILLTPVITMRLFALEKFSGTFETLMTAPVSDLQVVLAKFSAALLFYLVMWVPLLACVSVVRYYTNNTVPIDAGSISSTFLGILLLGGLFISAGCCASAITRSQVIAAVISLLFGCSLFLLGLFAHNLPEQSSWQAQALAHLSLFDHMHDFARGVVDTRPIVLLVTLTLFFLFLTLRVVESRRWK
jgi:gliding motility-associated transport system permease protein